MEIRSFRPRTKHGKSDKIMANNAVIRTYGLSTRNEWTKNSQQNRNRLYCTCLPVIKWNQLESIKMRQEQTQDKQASSNAFNLRCGRFFRKVNNICYLCLSNWLMSQFCFYFLSLSFWLLFFFFFMFDVCSLIHIFSVFQLLFCLIPAQRIIIQFE